MNWRHIPTWLPTGPSWNKFPKLVDKAVQSASVDWTATEDNMDKIEIGSKVNMQYADFLAEVVTVDTIEDGIVYGTADDGEPYCAPLANCERIPA